MKYQKIYRKMNYQILNIKNYQRQNEFNTFQKFLDNFLDRFIRRYHNWTIEDSPQIDI